jgi:hypothetical protein
MNKEITIANLRRSGYKVRVIHRNWNDEIDDGNVFYSSLAKDENPNVTQIDVTTPDRSATVSGFAYRCKGDQYNRKLGNTIALNRAIKQLTAETK